MKKTEEFLLLVRAAILPVAAAFPWLNPFAGGPSSAVIPWIVSAAFGLLLWSTTVLECKLPGTLRRVAWVPLAVVVWAAFSQWQVRPETAMLASGLLLMLLAAGFAQHPNSARAVQQGFLFAAAISAVLGVCQYFGIASQAHLWINAAVAGEAYGNLRQPNQYATLCWIGAAVILFGTIRLPRWAAPGVLLMLVVASAASVSRTGIFQGLFLTLLAATWRGPERKERLILCLVAAIGYFTAAVLLPSLLDALTGAMPARTLWGRLGGGPACSSRLVLWSNVLHLIALKPLTGWGWGELDYAHFDTLYSGPRFCDILDNAHNLPLHFAVELGVPVAAAGCGLAIWWAWRQRPWAEPVPLRQLAWALLTVILLHSMLEYPLWYGPFQIAFGVSLGWLMANKQASTAATPAREKLAALALGILLSAATAYAAWDYTRVSQIYLPPEQRLSPWRDDTLAKVRRSWLFSGQARFADLTLATPQRENAEWMYPLAIEVLHYSPEPRVIERAIESATYLGREDEAVLLLARYRAAFPRDYEAWRQAQKMPKLPQMPER
jgi:hypothetical protein